MSNCSVKQDENLAMLFHKTPATPIKSLQKTIRSSSRKRVLFENNNSENSEDLGPMSPLSVSSNSPISSPSSPCFSPNGKFSTPPRTPIRSTSTESRMTRGGRKIEVTSSLFPNLNVRGRKIPASPKAQENTSEWNPKDVEKVLKDLTTPPKSGRKRKRMDRHPETDEDEADSSSSQKNSDSTPRMDNSSASARSTPRFGIREISSESFYGPSPPVLKISPRPFTDASDKENNGKRTRSLSLDSSTSNRIFVSGSDRNKRRKTDGCTRSGGSKHGRQKGPHIGVWHGVKKPKKMKFSKKSNKPLVSPNSRISKMLAAESRNPIQVKPKPLFEDKPRRRVAHKKKKSCASPGEVEKGGIIDSFPNSLIRRKQLPSTLHPSSLDYEKEEPSTPDPDKKFMKHKTHRKATFTLNENVRLEFNDGVMRLGSPKKRRKLYSGKNDVFVDFRDEEENNPVEKSIEKILSKLEDDEDDKDKNGTPPEPSNLTLISKINEATLINILESPDTEVKIVEMNAATPLTEINSDASKKILMDLSSLEIKDEKNSAPFADGVEDSNLGLTGSMISETSNLLSGGETLLPGDSTSIAEHGSEAKSKEPKEKFFSVFYKENWNNLQLSNESSLAKQPLKKKSVKVPDDQYLLDAGQKSIGIVTCGKCGVMYQAGDFADEATHRNFHEHLPELRFTGWANERLVGKYPDGRVIMIMSCDPKSWWQKVSKIVGIIDEELGFPEGSVSALQFKTVYLFISEKAKQIVGCLIAEECKEAYKMFPPLEGVDVDSCSKDPSPCRIGISRIWTALNHRRSGVARRMIDCLQRTFFFGEIIPIDMIAFSVPSPSGKLLAQSVTGKMDFLVYGFA